MNKEQQIEEMAHIMCEYYNKGFCANGDITEICEDMPYCCYKNDAEALYNAGYGNVSEYKAERELLGSQIKVLKQRLNNKYIEVDNLNRDYSNAFERLKAQEREIMQLKAENARLTGRLGQVLLAVDTVKEMNAMCDIDDQRKQAVKEFAGKIKAKLNAIFGKTICSDLDTEDITDIIDEFIKEIEKQ